MTTPLSQHRQLNAVPWLIVVAIVVMYTQGVWSAIGAPTIIPRSIGEAFILAAIVITVRRVGFKAIYSDRLLLGASLIFVIATFVAFVLTEDTFLGLLLFVRLTMFTLVALIILNQAKFSSMASRAPAAIFEILLVIQVVVSIGKLAIVGPTERLIGTLSQQSGELSVVFPSIILALAFPLFGGTRSRTTKLVALGVIIGAFIMVVAGDKRAFMFVYFAMLSVYALLSAIKGDAKFGIKLRNYATTLIILGLVGILFSVFIVKFSPSLNPEQSRWGSLSFSWVRDYTTDYVFKESTHLYWVNSVVGTVVPTETPEFVKTPDPTATVVDLPTVVPTATVVDLPTVVPTETTVDSSTIVPTATPVPPRVIEEDAPDSVPLGRMAAFKSHLKSMTNDGHLLFGYGPGSAVDSSLHHSKQDIRRRFDFAWSLIGFNWILLQVGIIGAVGYVSAFAVVAWRGFQSMRKSPGDDNHLGMLVTLFMAVIMFDMFFYGITTIGSGIIFPVMAYFISNALKGRNSNVPIIRWLNMPGTTKKQRMYAAFYNPFSSSSSDE